MSQQRLRVLLAIVGLALILFSLSALAYASRAGESELLRESIEPTWFVPPQ
ncbi:MAG: hypothetical protein ACPGWR_04560 [Ardenticatenaceae bacterium]